MHSVCYFILFFDINLSKNFFLISIQNNTVFMWSNGTIRKNVNKNGHIDIYLYIYIYIYLKAEA